MKPPLMKETLDVELWEEQRVKDTPHGFFAKMMGREAAKVTSALRALGLVSSSRMEWYRYHVFYVRY